MPYIQRSANDLEFQVYHRFISWLMFIGRRSMTRQKKYNELYYEKNILSTPE